MPETENAIYDGLRALQWYQYLAVMWIIGGELRDLYADRLTEPERSLLADSLVVVRTAVLDREVTESTASSASRLASGWEPMITDDEEAVRPGHWNARFVLASLMGEIAGTGRQYEAAGRVHHAARMRFEEEPRPDGRPIWQTQDEEIDDASPKAQMLGLIRAIVTGAAQLRDDDELDPARLRTRLLTL